MIEIAATFLLVSLGVLALVGAWHIWATEKYLREDYDCSED
jgi:hypothetical protein